MSRTCFMYLLAAALWLQGGVGWAEQGGSSWSSQEEWGPAGSDENGQSSETGGTVAGVPAPPGVTVGDEPSTEAAMRQQVLEPADEPGAVPNDEVQAPVEEAQGWSKRIRFRFNGYSRMPLRFVCPPVRESEETADLKRPVVCRFRSPRLVDDDYYASGFSYTSLMPRDWTEIFFTADFGDVEVSVGTYASLFSDWAYTDSETQFGLAQGFLSWRNVGGLQPLSLKMGVFWERLGYLVPYDTYLFGRTHQMGLQAGWDFPNGARLRIGGGAHLEWADRRLGFAPLAYLFGGSPIGPVDVNAYVLLVWSDDRLPLQEATMKEGTLWVYGLDVKVNFPWFDGPLYLALAGYSMENVRFVGGALELMHSWSGQGLMDNYLGQQSNDGSGAMFVAAADWPIHLYAGLHLRAFGMLARIWSDQGDTRDALGNRDGRVAVKWGVEPAYQFFEWLRLSLRYDRVINDMKRNGTSFRVLSPTVTLTAFQNEASTQRVDILLRYSHYFYGDDLRLRPGQVPGQQMPDEDSFMIMGSATW